MPETQREDLKVRDLRSPNFESYVNPRTGSATLEQYAIQAGGALGRVVAKLREVRDEIQELANETGEIAAASFDELAHTASSRAKEWREKAASGMEDLGHAVAEEAVRLRSRARTGMQEARFQVVRVRREYPVQAIMAACALGVVLGVGLRIWRSNRVR